MKKTTFVERNDLLLVVPKGWDIYISCEFDEIHSFLTELGWTKITIDEEHDSKVVELIKNSSLVILWEAYEFLDRNSEVFHFSNIKKIFYCDDSHYFNQKRREQRLQAFQWADLILTAYAYKIKEWYPEVPSEKIHWLPHAAGSSFYPLYEPQHEKILLSGSRTWPYPFRQFCYLKLPPNICAKIDHPGYPGYPGDRLNTSRADGVRLKNFGREQYAELLRQYPAMVVCGSIFQYLVAKVFEAMAAGCLVLCDLPTLKGPMEQLGFVEGVHFIGTDVFHVEEDAYEILRIFRQDYSKWREITEKAYEKITAEHTTQIRALQIHHLCKGN